MSEPETEQETEQETDAEATPFASAPWKPERPDESGHAHVWGSDGDLVATVCSSPVYDETSFDRAGLIAAAGTAAKEAKEMGYDPVAAVENTPKQLTALKRCRRYFREQYRKGELGALRSSILSEVEDALGSAEGSSGE